MQKRNGKQRMGTHKMEDGNEETATRREISQ